VDEIDTSVIFQAMKNEKELDIETARKIRRNKQDYGMLMAY